jgi:hypothetical protein
MLRIARRISASTSERVGNSSVVVASDEEEVTESAALELIYEIP